MSVYFQADQDMIDTMSQKLQESLEVALKYPELHKTCKDNLSKLDTFYVNYIMKFDYKNSDLSQGDMIGSGSYANVYKGVLTDSGKEVAVKIAKDVVNMSNVTDVLTEDKIMRWVAFLFVKIISIWHKCEVRIDKFVPMVTVLAYEALPSDAKQVARGTDLSICTLQ